jgi:hypothetical protein
MGVKGRAGTKWMGFISRETCMHSRMHLSHVNFFIFSFLLYTYGISPLLSGISSFTDVLSMRTLRYLIYSVFKACMCAWILESSQSHSYLLTG